MKNGHNDMLEPIGAIPFVFSTSSFLANGFSTLRFLLCYAVILSGHGLVVHPEK
jgi:hypothetical protein